MWALNLADGKPAWKTGDVALPPGATPSGSGYLGQQRLYVPVFDIDIAKCCYCGLCVYPCPTECIKMTDVYEFSEFDRENLIYRFATMTPAEAETAKTRLSSYEKEKVEAAALSAAAKMAPSVAPLKPQAPSNAPSVAPSPPKPPAAPATPPPGSDAPGTKG